LTHKFLPPHLRKYVVPQDYDRYTSIDHAVWRFIMRISVEFFKQYAHHSYLKGLEKTGISINIIPRIEEMDRKLSEFGWGAVCVRGFIPPAAFMELQSLGILAIAADMRTLKHLSYTPAPDIVHEAAGHAPILADQDYADYLHHYGEVASKAIASKDDIALYEAIRNLSDIKEDSSSTPNQIDQAESDLQTSIENIQYISEAAYLARMNWWTVEYGLVGDINNPKIYGAGLLSSVGESQNCITDAVKKIPFSLNCINTSYDITEPQPQLFVTPDFNSLNSVLDEMAETMAFKLGGCEALEKAKSAGTICTAEYESNLQISGVLSNYIKDKFGEPAYLQYEGPVQICRFGNEIKGQGGDYHNLGFGSPVGRIIDVYKPVCDFNNDEIDQFRIFVGNLTTLEFESGVIIKGKISKILEKNKRIYILSFKECTVTLGDEILFQPEWGIYDMTCGAEIVSVYGGPADWGNYCNYIPEYDPEFKNKYNEINRSNNEQNLCELYNAVRLIRDSKQIDSEQISDIVDALNLNHEDDWILKMEILELISEDCFHFHPIYNELSQKQNISKDTRQIIDRGLKLINTPKKILKSI